MKRIIKLNKKGEIIKLIEKIFIDPSFFGAKFYFSNLMCIVNQGVYCEDCAVPGELDVKYDLCTCEKCYDPNGCKQNYCICGYDSSTMTMLLKTLEILDEYVTDETTKKKLIKTLFDKFLYFKLDNFIRMIDLYNENDDIESLRNQKNTKEVIDLYNNPLIQDYMNSNYINIDDYYRDIINDFIKSKNPRRTSINDKKKTKKKPIKRR